MNTEIDVNEHGIFVNNYYIFCMGKVQKQKEQK